MSNAGGHSAVWSRDGRELFYWIGAQGAVGGQIMAVPVMTGEKFTFGTPQVVAKGEFQRPQAGRPFDVSPDGKRFIVIKDAAEETATPTQLVVVLNWAEELKRLVP